MDRRLNRRQVLEQVARGELSAVEGNRRLNGAPSLAEPGPVPPAEGAGAQTAEAEIVEPRFSAWQRWWIIPFSASLVFTLLMAWLAYWALVAQGMTFWFFLAIFFFLVGTAGMALSWQARLGRWLHLRIHQRPGEQPEYLAISLPLPLGIVAWFLRKFGRFIPDLEGIPLDEVVQMVDQGVSTDGPLYVHVNGDDGEEVEIFLG